MTLDGFLTVLALLAAIYAVLPPVQRLRLSLSWWPQALVAVPACAAILVLEFFEVGPPACPATLGEICRLLILSDAEPGLSRKLAFLVALAWLIAATVIHHRSRPGLGALPRFTRLATTLIDDEQYDDAIRLVEPEVGLIAKASRRRSRRQRLHDWLADFGPVAQDSFAYFARRPGPKRFTGADWPEWSAKPFNWLAHLVPSHERAEQAATEFLRLLLNSRRLLDYIVDRRPYFAVTLARHDVFGAPDFFERFLGRLAANPGSALYQELSTNQVSEGSVGYALPTGNRLLHFLFADASVAERLSAWKPVGDYVERLLDGEERAGYWDRLNGDPGWFDREQFSDPVFMGMFYFDVMVTSAARQGIEYHMWLYYLPHIADRLEAGYDSSGEGIDKDAEFPTRAARLLYELFGFLTSWVGLFDRLPDDSPLRRMPQKHDNATAIPHSAALALGATLANVAASSRIDHGVIRTLHDVTMRAIRRLHDQGDTGEMRKYVIEAILGAGHRTAPNGHVARLSSLFAQMDHIEQYELADYEAALNARVAASSQRRGRRAATSMPD